MLSCNPNGTWSGGEIKFTVAGLSLFGWGALAGGLDTFASEKKIKILWRNSEGKQVAVPFSYAKVKSGQDLESNIILS